MQKWTDRTFKRSETEIRNIWSNWADKLTEPCFHHSAETDKISISPASHFKNFFASPHLAHLQSR
jgi:hypothetical protein